MTRRALTPTACMVAAVACLSAAAPTTPTFFGRRDYLGLNANWVQVADVNGDGIRWCAKCHPHQCSGGVTSDKVVSSYKRLSEVERAFVV
jgi:hypothetical protein